MFINGKKEICPRKTRITRKKVKKIYLKLVKIKVKLRVSQII